MIPSPNQLTLGQLIDAFEKRPLDHGVFFDFGNMVPSGELNSYRGFYEDLAIGFERISPSFPDVEDMLSGLRRVTLGVEFEGYKGGRYKMDRETSLWVANIGESTGTIITGIADYDSSTVLLTSWVSR